MPTPKKKFDTVTIKVRTFRLSEYARKAIKSALAPTRKGREAAFRKDAYKEIEKAISFYNGGKEIIDHPIRPTDFNVSLAPIIKNCVTLAIDLEKLPSGIKGELEKESRLEAAQLIEELTLIKNAARTVAFRVRPSRGRGAPRKIARDILIGSLRKVFARYHLPAAGVAEPLAKLNRRQAKFISVVLDHAGIQIPKGLRTLISNPTPETALPYLNERQMLIERIASSKGARKLRNVEWDPSPLASPQPRKKR